MSVPALHKSVGNRIADIVQIFRDLIAHDARKALIGRGCRCRQPLLRQAAQVFHVLNAHGLHNVINNRVAHRRCARLQSRIDPLLCHAVINVQSKVERAVCWQRALIRAHHSISIIRNGALLINATTNDSISSAHAKRTACRHASRNAANKRPDDFRRHAIGSNLIRNSRASAGPKGGCCLNPSRSQGTGRSSGNSKRRTNGGCSDLFTYPARHAQSCRAWFWNIRADRGHPVIDHF